MELPIADDQWELQTHESLSYNSNVQSNTLFDESGYTNDSKTTTPNKNIGKYQLSPWRKNSNTKDMTPFIVQ